MLNQYLKIFLCAGFLFTQLLTSHAEPNVCVGESVPPFILEDADENRYALEKMKGKVIILIMGNKNTREDVDAWAASLKQTFPKNENLEIFSVAEMRYVPFFISKSFVRKKVKEEKCPVTILLDWGQKVNKLLGATRDKTDIFVIDPYGLLAYHRVVPYSEETFRFLRAKIEEALEANSLKEKKSKKERSK